MAIKWCILTHDKPPYKTRTTKYIEGPLHKPKTTVYNIIILFYSWGNFFQNGKNLCVLVAKFQEKFILPVMLTYFTELAYLKLNDKFLKILTWYYFIHVLFTHITFILFLQRRGPWRLEIFI